MALTTARWQRIVLFAALYIAQGIPHGFIIVSLPAWLMADHGFTAAAVGHLRAVTLLPWSLKFLWIPLVETFTYRPMGRRRPWIMAAQLMMAASLLGMLGLGTPSMERLIGLFVLHNCFEAQRHQSASRTTGHWKATGPFKRAPQKRE